MPGAWPTVPGWEGFAWALGPLGLVGPVEGLADGLPAEAPPVLPPELPELLWASAMLTDISSAASIAIGVVS